MQETLEHARRRKAAVLRGRCYDHLDLPYLPLRDSLFPAIGAGADGELTTEPSAAPEAIQRERNRQLLALTDLVLAHVRTHPTVLFVDDVDWANAATVDLLRHLLFRLDDEQVPLLLVATTRADPGRARPTAWPSAIRAPHRGGAPQPDDAARGDRARPRARRRDHDRPRPRAGVGERRQPAARRGARARPSGQAQPPRPVVHASDRRRHHRVARLALPLPRHAPCSQSPCSVPTRSVVALSRTDAAARVRVLVDDGIDTGDGIRGVAPAGDDYFEVDALRGPTVVEFAIATPRPYGHSSVMAMADDLRTGRISFAPPRS